MSTATAVVELCNRALDRIGEDHIASLTEDSQSARLCNQNWGSVRDLVLSFYEWPSFITRQPLAEAGGDNLTIYEYKYQIPTDPFPLRIITLVDEYGYDSDSYSYPRVTYRHGDTRHGESWNRVQWIYEWRREGDYIYTDLPNAYLKYVYREEDPTNYPPLIKDGAVGLLASRIALRTTQNMQYTGTLYQEAMAALGEAIAQEQVTGGNMEMPSALWSDFER